jgi:hypothetical protein
MILTEKQKALKERRDFIYKSYLNLKDEMPVSIIVKSLSDKFKITEVQVYNDIKFMKLQNT